MYTTQHKTQNTIWRSFFHSLLTRSCFCSTPSPNPVLYARKWSFPAIFCVGLGRKGAPLSRKGWLILYYAMRVHLCEYSSLTSRPPFWNSPDIPLWPLTSNILRYPTGWTARGQRSKGNTKMADEMWDWSIRRIRSSSHVCLLANPGRWIAIHNTQVQPYKWQGKIRSLCDTQHFRKYN
jgi:hypothetical protein